MDLVEVEKTISVPVNTGIAGFLRTIELILRKPRVQQITIDARGMVRYRHYVSETERENANNFSVDFEDLEPYYIIRNSTIKPVDLGDGFPIAPIVIGQLFDVVATDQLKPLAFVVSPDTVLWNWYVASSGAPLRSSSHFFGIPILVDKSLPETALILCAGYGRDSAFIDTQVSYKIDMPPLSALR